MLNPISLISRLLMAFAFVMMFGFVVLPVLPFSEDMTWIDSTMARFFCTSGETLRRDLYQTTDSDGTSYSMDVFCVDPLGQQRDVTGYWFFLGIGGFMLPFLVGIGLFIFSKFKGSLPAVVMPSQPRTVNEQLQDLQTARLNGKISEEEFQRRRAKLLE